MKLYAVYRILATPICGKNEEILVLRDDKGSALEYVSNMQKVEPNAKFEVKYVMVKNGDIIQVDNNDDEK